MRQLRKAFIWAEDETAKPDELTIIGADADKYDNDGIHLGNTDTIIVDDILEVNKNKNQEVCIKNLQADVVSADTINYILGDLPSSVTTLQATVGNTDSGLVKAVSDESLARIAMNTALERGIGEVRSDLADTNASVNNLYQTLNQGYVYVCTITTDFSLSIPNSVSVFDQYGTGYGANQDAAKSTLTTFLENAHASIKTKLHNLGLTSTTTEYLVINAIQATENANVYSMQLKGEFKYNDVWSLDDCSFNFQVFKPGHTAKAKIRMIVYAPAVTLTSA